jgi:hypothetical protein
MNEDQAKYARDLATVSHAVMKLLGLVFTRPAIYGLFDGALALAQIPFSPCFFVLVD